MADLQDQLYRVGDTQIFAIGQDLGAFLFASAGLRFALNQIDKVGRNRDPTLCERRDDFTHWGMTILGQDLPDSRRLVHAVLVRFALRHFLVSWLGWGKGLCSYYRAKAASVYGKEYPVTHSAK